MHRTMLLVLLSLSSPMWGQAADPGVRVPEGFAVTEWADSAVANDIHCITFAADGRLIAAGRNYLRIIDGTSAERAGKTTDFAHPPADGAMGLLWNEGHLYATGGGGLRRYADVDAGGHAKPSELLFACKTGGEHDAHAIVRNRDGWFYLLCGNGTGIAAKHATLETSPIKTPLAGCLLRFPPDFKGCEIVADGFRNPYGLDFNNAGELFTYDSDNERCVGLPWYEFTRAYHILPGARHGWMSPQRGETWRMPPYFADIARPLAHLDRGSPTGVTIYRHLQFPEKYRGGMFALDWTFGRVWFLPLVRDGSGFRTTPERFLETTGEAGFAPTSAAVNPLTGDLFVSIGGRGTRGAIYRIRYTAGHPAADPKPVPTLPGLEWREPEEWIRWSRANALPVRRKALEFLTRFADRIDVAKLVDAVTFNLASEDRLIRQETARLIQRLPKEAREKLTTTMPRGRITLSLADPARDSLLDLVIDAKQPAEIRLDAVRGLQRWLGDVSGKGGAFEGYTLGPPAGTLMAVQKASLVAALGTEPNSLNREIARTLALLAIDSPEAVARTLAAIAPDTLAAEDVHFLLVLSKLPSKRDADQTRRTAQALLDLDAKQANEKQAIDSHWPRRLGELQRELSARDPFLNATILAAKDFTRPAHASFARSPGFDRATAGRKLLPSAGKARVTPDLLALIGELPAKESRPVLRQLWGEAGLDDAILSLLARDPEAIDRARFVEALAFGQPERVQEAAKALAKLGASTEGDETLALVKALRDVPPGKEFDGHRAEIATTLQGQTGQKLTTLAEWSAWLRETDAPRAKRLDQGGIDRAAWAKRLSAIDWSVGDIEKGREVYTKASCAACHSGSQALGPDLRGITGRFSRDDLFASLLEPSKDVPARYRMTIFTTEAGKVYQGIVIYDATDSLILQTGPAATLRLDSPRIRERRTSLQSLMPAGLLDKLSDRELGDLFAYLRSLK